MEFATRLQNRSLKQHAISVAQLVVILLLAGSPWWFGAVPIPAQIALHLATFTTLCIWFIIIILDDRSTWRMPLVTIPLLGGLLIGVLQLLPMNFDSSFMTRLSSGQLQRQLLPATTSPSEPNPREERSETSNRKITTTLNPAATRKELTLLILAISLFLLGTKLFRRHVTYVGLCAALAINGMVLTIFSFIQKFTWNGKLYWVYTPPPRGTYFGPFIYHNQAANYLVICFIGNVVWLMYLLRDSSETNSDLFSFRSSHFLSFLSQQWSRFAARLDGLRMAVLGLLVFNIAGILGTLSRGAFISTLAGILVVSMAELVVKKKYSLVCFFGICGVAALAIIAWIGMFDSFTDRISTLLHSEAKFAAEPRLDHWSSAVSVLQKFWGVGCGLGGYRFVSQLGQADYDGIWWVHAHNQYLETIVDGGLIALGLVFSAILLVGRACWRLLISQDETDRIFAVSGILILTVQVVHAIGEFVLYLPANTIITAVFCGAVTARSIKKDDLSVKTRSKRQIMEALVVFLLILGTIWSHRELRNQGQVTAAFKAIPWGESKDEVPSEVLDRRISDLEMALRRQPDSAEGHYALARLLVLRYRYRALEQMQRETDAEVDEASLWNLTSTLALHRLAHERSGRNNREISEIPLVKEHLLPAVTHFHLSRDACPLLPWVHLGLAELSFLPLETEDDEIHLERAKLLASTDVDLLFRAGQIDYFARRYALAYDNWKRCLQLHPRHLENIFGYSSSRLNASELLRQVLPDLPLMVIQLVEKHYSQQENTSDRLLLLDHALGLIEKSALPAYERYYLRSRALILRGSPEKAIESLRKAVMLQPDNFLWRRRFAFLLRDQGMLVEAEHQARLCLNQQPLKADLRRLLDNIIRRQQQRRSK